MGTAFVVFPVVAVVVVVIGIVLLLLLELLGDDFTVNAKVVFCSRCGTANDTRLRRTSYSAKEYYLGRCSCRVNSEEHWPRFDVSYGAVVSESTSPTHIGPPPKQPIHPIKPPSRIQSRLCSLGSAIYLILPSSRMMVSCDG